MRVPTTFDVLAAMREAGGWYRRTRKRVLPALWLSTERGTFAPATWLDVVEFLWETYAPVLAAHTRPELRLLAEAIIAEARYHPHGLPAITDDVLELVMPCSR